VVRNATKPCPIHFLKGEISNAISLEARLSG
jgi:hypothetical protein